MVHVLKKQVALLGLSLLAALPAFSAPGEAGFDLLRRDLNAASVAVASATVAYPQVTAIGGNPALLASKDFKISSAGYVDDPMDLKSGNLFYAQPLNGYVIGARLTYYDYGSFDKMSVTGNPEGTFSASDLFLGVGIAKRFDEVLVGIEPGYLSSKIESYQASAMTFSAGIQYTPSFISLTTIGADVRNLGSNVKKYGESSTPLPTEMRIGFSKRLEHLPLTLLAQGNKWRDSDWYLNAGGEFDVAESIRLRVGYSTLGKDQKSNNTSESIAGISGGFGVHYRDYLFDFAYSLQGAIGDRIYMQFSWIPQTAISLP